MSQTGENEQGLRKIVDLTRLASIFILLLHFYYYCYTAFKQWEFRSTITDRLMANIMHTGLFISLYISKFIAIGLLVISLLGAQGKKDEKINWKVVASYLLIGFMLFFSSGMLFNLNYSLEKIAIIYMVVTSIGFLLILAGGNLLSRLVRLNLSNDVFNSLNETFPQEERLLTNEYAINLPARYNLKGRIRKSWINIINPFRGLLVIGSPGAGKSWFVIQHVIKQHIEKGFAMFVYDFKYDDLSKIVYNWLQQNKHNYPVKPSFYVINFDNLSISHRCNPLDPNTMNDITDATESARTILLGLNREWINKQGDFFVESPINFVTAIIWFLKKYEDGKYCTLPHVIELMQSDYDELFPVLNTQPEIEVLVNPFITAYQNDAMEQLEGQVASAKIGMARLASPQLYWVLSGNDFTLDINNPKHPKIVCVGNNPEKQQIYGAVLSLYISRLIRQVNRKGMLKCSLVFDEFPTIYFNNMDSLIATARSNKVATTLAMQDFSQLKKDYGKEQADVIVNITGNIISGQVMGETSKLLSERFGKIMQDRQSVSVNRLDTSISHSKQLDSAIPASKIAALSSGEFVGLVADNPDEKIKLKMFHGEIINDADKLNQEVSRYKDIPVVCNVTQQQVLDNYYQVKMEVKKLIGEEVIKLKKNLA
ncbi:conjugal transfer protein MobC [Ferruginibacter paludis]|uniref:conjugal transfer protein MobC n=1 Tax=Ferruginibacter paludis TaxID=1310417 RepID=UPI0025B3561B|nr:conjugal transfer protein MobC [Ferruginibacter paludis]MDN3653993.1 conjugal transfer protein MobC [Ferruginibacter paludis]